MSSANTTAVMLAFLVFLFCAMLAIVLTAPSIDGPANVPTPYCGERNVRRLAARTDWPAVYETVLAMQQDPRLRLEARLKYGLEACGDEVSTP